MSDSVVVSTLLTTLRAIATVLVVYAAGFLLVRFKRVDADGVAALASLANTVFLPSLLFFRLGGNLSAEILSYAWPFIVTSVRSQENLFTFPMVNLIVGS